MNSRARSIGSESGFTLAEVLVSTAIMMIALGAVFSVLNPSQGTFQAQPEVADLQQRMRVSVDTLNKDIVMAGAGMYSGPLGTNSGTLANFFAPVMPYRTGALNPDPPGTFKTDTISIFYIPETAAQTTISDPMPPTSNELKVNAQQGGCPGDTAKYPLCGFKEGMQVIIFDDTGAMNTFVITNVQESAGHIQRHGPDFVHSYGPNSWITQAHTVTYYLKSSDATSTWQLMMYDGDLTDTPVVDNVVGLSFEYYGEPAPPQLRKPLADATTYGPKPPPLGVNNGLGWPDGENCVFMVSGGQQIPRLPDLAPGSTGLVPLTAGMLTDGPWCPNTTSAARWDADLLRIREVRVRIRVQVAPKMLRGTGALFSKPGTAKGGTMWVPDQEIRFDVAPRNLNLGR